MNAYRTGVPPGAPLRGEPDPVFHRFLEVRSSLHFEKFQGLGASVGKVIIGLGKGDKPLKIIVQPNGVAGLSLEVFRDRLFNEGVGNAVFMDGSDLAMLFANGKFYVQQGTKKNWTNKAGIGFQLPDASVKPGGRSMGHG